MRISDWSSYVCSSDLRQRTRIADAGRAAIADEIVADRVEMILQARLGQIVGDDLRPRRETGLDPWLRLHAALVRFLGDKTGGDHDAGVRGVGAARDRGDHQDRKSTRLNSSH